jgi:large subunit ribosomal protein L5
VEMREILLDKVVVNMGVGNNPDDMKKAQQVIEMITGKKSMKTKTQLRIPTWDLRPGLEIGLKVTLRENNAKEFLEKALVAKDKQLKAKNFDQRGNFGFGIKEYIDVPGTKYDPKLGIRGFDVLVSLKRRGDRVSKRKIRPAKLGKNHIITKPEAIEFVKAMGVEVL